MEFGKGKNRIEPQIEQIWCCSSQLASHFPGAEHKQQTIQAAVKELLCYYKP